MNVRQMKKEIGKQIKQKNLQELELLLSAHWERQITNQEIQEALEEKFFGFRNEETKNKSAKAILFIRHIIEENQLNNNRHLKRKRLFSTESLAIRIFSEAEKMPR